MNPTTTPLAIAGGPPTLPEGPPLWPQPDDEIHAALEAAYRDGSWGKYHAGQVTRLEQELAKLHGVEHALTCASGTFAVELALRALKIGSGDEVLLAGYDFSGNFRAIEAVGARPVLLDIEPTTWCVAADALSQACSSQTKGLIVSHLHGGLAEMSALVEFCREHGIAVVEDACQVPGANVAGRMAGTWGDVGVLSFGGSKLLTAGRGGAIVTASAAIAQRAKIFCERGNHAFPLSELQAAVLLPQLPKLAAANDVRRLRAEQLRAGTSQLPGLMPVESPSERGDATYYKFAWLYDSAACGGRSREQFLQALQAEGVAVDAGFRGFAGRSAARCRRVGELTHSREAAERTVLLHHPVLLESSATIDRVSAAFTKVVTAFSH